MSPLSHFAAALAFLGRHGTYAVALSIFAGLALPWLATAFKPWLRETIFLLLMLAFLRVDPAALRDLARRPAIVFAAAFWVMLVLPAALGALFLLMGLNLTLPA